MSFFLRSSKLAFQRSIINKSTITPTRNNFVRTFTSTKINMGVHNLSTKEAFQTAISEKDVVVLDAFATWCGPCKAIAPQVNKFSETYPSAHFVKIDVDELPELAAELKVRAMPTFLIFKGGKQVAQVVGANPQALEEAIKGATVVAASPVENSSAVDAPAAE
ncbi:thioredoxin trx1 [Clarireedia jacksonii]